MDRLLAGKEKNRRELAALPFHEKIKLIEMMQERSRLIARSRPHVVHSEQQTSLIQNQTALGVQVSPCGPISADVVNGE